MVNTLGLKKADVLAALGAYAGIQWKAVKPRFFSLHRPTNCFYAMVKNALVILDLRADDGFDEYAYDCALGAGSAQRAVDRLRAEKGGGGREEAEQL